MSGPGWTYEVASRYPFWAKDTGWFFVFTGITVAFWNGLTLMILLTIGEVDLEVTALFFGSGTAFLFIGFLILSRPRSRVLASIPVGLVIYGLCFYGSLVSGFASIESKPRWGDGLTQNSFLVINKVSASTPMLLTLILLIWPLSALFFLATWSYCNFRNARAFGRGP